MIFHLIFIHRCHFFYLPFQVTLLLCVCVGFTIYIYIYLCMCVHVLFLLLLSFAISPDCPSSPSILRLFLPSNLVVVSLFVFASFSVSFLALHTRAILLFVLLLPFSLTSRIEADRNVVCMWSKFQESVLFVSPVIRSLILYSTRSFRSLPATYSTTRTNAEC